MTRAKRASWPTSVTGSGATSRIEPFVETRTAEACLSERHQRALLHPAAIVSSLWITHDLTPVADGLQITGDHFVEGCSLGSGDLDDAIAWRRDCHIGDK